jgi:hypothetical protein
MIVFQILNDIPKLPLVGISTKYTNAIKTRKTMNTVNTIEGFFLSVTLTPAETAIFI